MLRSCRLLFFFCCCSSVLVARLAVRVVPQVRALAEALSVVEIERGIDCDSYARMDNEGAERRRYKCSEASWAERHEAASPCACSTLDLEISSSRDLALNRTMRPLHCSGTQDSGWRHRLASDTGAVCRQPCEPGPRASQRTAADRELAAAAAPADDRWGIGTEGGASTVNLFDASQRFPAMHQDNR